MTQGPFQVYTHQSRLQHWRHIIEIAAIAGAAVWGLYVFIYQEHIKPAAEPPQLEHAISITQNALPNNRELISFQQTLSNVGTSTIYLAGIAMNVYAVRFGDRMQTTTEPLSHGSGTSTYSIPAKSQTLLYSIGESMEPLGSTHWIHLQPSTRYAFTRTVVVPASWMDAVRITWQTCFTKSPSRHWQLPLERRPDGSLTFVDSQHVVSDDPNGLICYSGDGYYAL